MGGDWPCHARASYSSGASARWAGLSRSPRVHPTLLDVETIRLLASGDSATTGIGVVGVKWNVARTVLVSASLLLPLNDRSLKSRPAPAISIEHARSRDDVGERATER